MIIVDPPLGRRYGFPAPLEDDYEAQLLKAGYPGEDIELALKWSMYWEVDEVQD